MLRFLLVCLGGAAGTGTRYLVNLAFARRVSFPYATLLVNVTGCFLMAAVLHVATTRSLSPDLRLTLTTGFLGGLTTYSAFNHETTSLLHADATRTALLNLLLTLTLCFLSGLLGLLLARRLAP